MSFPTEHIINAVVIGLVTIFLAKLFAPIVMSIFSPYKDNKKKGVGSTNLEAMIAHKEALLRKGENSSSGPVNNNALAAGIDAKKSNRSEVELRYLDRKDNTEDEDEKMEMIKVCTLFESLQWGEGPAINEIRQKFNKKFGTAPGQRIFINNLKNLIKREIPISRVTKNLPSYEELVELIIVKTFLQSLACPDEYTPEITKAVSRKLRISASSLSKAVATLLAKTQGMNEQKIYPSLLEAKDAFSFWDIPMRENLINKTLVSTNKKYFINIKELIELISSEAHLYHSLSPLPDLKGKNDIKGALSLFGLKEDATADQIKKAYKKISMLKHPDRLASKGIPKAFEEIAHENFTRIQSAYELIKK